MTSHTDLIKMVEFLVPVISVPIVDFVLSSHFVWVMVMVFSATFNNFSDVSWLSVLLVEEIGENHRPAVNH